jgi:hypothetical protein
MGFISGGLCSYLGLKFFPGSGIMKQTAAVLIICGGRSDKPVFDGRSFEKIVQATRRRHIP